MTKGNGMRRPCRQILCPAAADEVRTGTVYNVGIRKFGQVYNHPELIYYMDKPVDIKYDPEDVTRLLVFDAQDGI